MRVDLPGPHTSSQDSGLRTVDGFVVNRSAVRLVHGGLRITLLSWSVGLAQLA